MTPDLWYDPRKAARLTGSSRPKLAKLAQAGKIIARFAPDGTPVAYAEEDVARIRRERNRLAADRKKQASRHEIMANKTPLEQMQHPQTRLRERPQDQRVLPWCPHESGNPKI